MKTSAQKFQLHSMPWRGKTHYRSVRWPSRTLCGIRAPATGDGAKYVSGKLVCKKCRWRLSRGEGPF